MEDKTLESYCHLIAIPGEAPKKKVIPVIRSDNHWDLGAIFTEKARIIFNNGTEWIKARRLILNFDRRGAPKQRGDRRDSHYSRNGNREMCEGTARATPSDSLRETRIRRIYVLGPTQRHVGKAGERSAEDNSLEKGNPISSLVRKRDQSR